MNVSIKKVMGVLLVTVVFGFFTVASADKDNCDVKIKYLYVTTAISGNLIYSKQLNAYQLTLYKIDPWVIYFSKVPHTDSGFTKAPDFVKEVQKEITEKYPKGLNSGLTVFEINNKEQKATRYTLTIKDPVYDEKTHTMRFSADLLNGDKSKLFIDKLIFKHAALFVDDMDNAAGGGGSW